MAGKLSIIALVFVSGVFLGTKATAQFRTGKTTQLLKADVAGCDGKEITVTLNEFGPGTSGPHYHPAEGRARRGRRALPISRN